MTALLRRGLLCILLTGVLINSGCSATQTPLYSGTAQCIEQIEAKPLQTGFASWYGPGFHGRRTANGERFNQNSFTAAHKTLPFGSLVEVRDVNTNKTVRVRINDRGPFIRGRVIDLSRAAGSALGITKKGTARIELRIIRG